MDSEEENSQEQGDNDSDEGSDEDRDDDDQESSSSITPVKPENYAIKQMSFRERRGTKMKTLMDRKK